VSVFGWIVFSLFSPFQILDSGGLGVWPTIGLTTFLHVFHANLGAKDLSNKTLPWSIKKLAWPEAYFSAILHLLFSSIFFTWVVIGDFMPFLELYYWRALGDSGHLTEKAKEILQPVYQQYFCGQILFLYRSDLKGISCSLWFPGIVGVVLFCTSIDQIIGGLISEADLASFTSTQKKRWVIGFGPRVTRGVWIIILGLSHWKMGDD